MGSKLLRTDLLTGDSLSFSTKALIAAVLFYQLLFTFQGLDFTDTGFHMTAYQQIFTHPETVHYSFMFWLSDVLGGLWMKVFPGLWPNRLAAVLVHSFTFYLYFLLLRPLTGANKAAIYTCLSLLFFQYYGFETLNYDSFTIAAFTLAVYCLVYGILHDKLILLSLGAFVVGVSTYLRITNLAALGFVPLAWLCYWYYYGRNKKLISIALGTLVSYALGHALVLVAMSYMDHLELFLSNMAFVKSMGAAGDSSHGLVPVMILLAKGWIKIGLAALLVASLAYGYTRYKSEKWLYWAIALVGILWISLLLIYPTEVWSKMRYLLFGSILLSAIQVMFNSDKQVSILAIFGLAIMFVFPLGSDSGIEKLYFATGLSTALLFYQLDKSGADSHLLNMLLAIFIVTCIYFGYSNTYFDGGSRVDKTSSVDHPNLGYIYTTPKRAAEIEGLLTVLDTIVQEDDYLLAFSDIPMVNYLTSTKPYIGTSWPKLYYASQIFHDELMNAQEENGLAVVVMQKMEMRSAWPTSSTPRYLDMTLGSTYLSEDNGPLWTHPENRLPYHYHIMFNFIEQHNYQEVWESDAFRIYKPAIPTPH